VDPVGKREVFFTCRESNYDSLFFHP
jgi:hypothetical protein